MRTERTSDRLIITPTVDPVHQGMNLAQLVLAQVQAGDRLVVLDFSLVSMLHSPGLANLVGIYVSLAKRGIQLELQGLNEHNRKLLQITQLDKLFAIAA